MSEANLNPYKSPQGTDDKVKPSDLVEPMTLAELQARGLQLEKQVKSNWFLGPLWKKSLAVVGYFLIGYAMLAVVYLTIVLVVGAILMLFGVIDNWNEMF